MGDDDREWYEQLLDLQLRANPAIWKHMRELGVDEHTHLRLAFTYLAPGLQEADRLAAFLHQQVAHVRLDRPLAAVQALRCAAPK